MSKIVFILLAGAIGGALRGVLGIAKSLVTKKDVSINCGLGPDTIPACQIAYGVL